ncbi:MAG: argininosuccinate lyase [Gammaproteobacteria bacterium]|nr:argininosuccinate lyase [Gammaproteobacteria bacterium]
MHFLAGEDVQLDRKLFLFDIQATQAHVQGLASINVLSAAECMALCEELDRLADAFARGDFALDGQFEDGHSAIEHWLTSRLGDVGAKVHTGRSRNDQVLVASRLYLLHSLEQVATHCIDIASVCLERAAGSADVPMPGYTHLQRAVVSSLGMWFAGFAEAFADNYQLACHTLDWINSNPLGTAAGYGVNLPLDRDLTTKTLGFDRMQVNPIYTQNSRGKFELQSLMVVAQSLQDVRRLAWDLSLYTTAEFNFVRLPEKYTTGSSIMPNKRNPDVVELLRSAAGVVQGAMAELSSILSLPSGYHRDLQGTKAPLLRATEHGIAALALIPDLLANLEFDRNTMTEAIDNGMFATDMAVDLAAQNIPFRQAYRQVKESLDDIKEFSASDSLKQRTSPGAAADLRLEQIRRRLMRTSDK